VSTTAGQPSAERKNWIYSNRPKITISGPASCHKQPAGYFLFPASITTPITSFGDDISPHPTIFYEHINKREDMKRKIINVPTSNAQHYEIRLKGHLEARWSNRFEGLTITLEEDGNTLLSGPVADQAALHGWLKKVRDLGITLVSVVQVQLDETHPYRSKKEKK
jgi:hypothetical protein